MEPARWLGIEMAGPLIGLLAVAGCDTRDLGPPRMIEERVELGDAESVRAQIRMGAGELRMQGGATDLLDASFHTNMGRPEVRYDVFAGRGRLEIEQDNARGGPNMTNEWDLRLNDGVSADLEVKLGAGKNDLDFSTLKLRRAEIEMGVGELRLDLRGDYQEDVVVNVRGGVGEANIRLPSRVGVRVDAKGGIGEIRARGLTKRDDYYYNDAWENSRVRMRVEVRGGVGQINLEGEE
jgi:hypothetical protein